MERVSILEFRRRAEEIIRKVTSGQRLILTYRGKPVVRLEPIAAKTISADDSFYTLDRMAVPEGTSLSNEEIDRIIYGQ